MKDKYMRVWDSNRGVGYIVTDDTFKHGLSPAPARNVLHQGDFTRWSARWAAVKVMMREEYRCDDFMGRPSYRFPLAEYVESCKTAHAEEVKPFPRTKVSQVVTTYDDGKGDTND